MILIKVVIIGLMGFYCGMWGMYRRCRNHPKNSTQLPPMVECMQALNFWNDGDVDNIASNAARDMYVYIQQRLHKDK